MHLTENMRISRARLAGADTHELREFNAWLLRLGEGTEPHTADGLIEESFFFLCES